MTLLRKVKSVLGIDTSESENAQEAEAARDETGAEQGADDVEATTGTPLDGDVPQRGELTLESSAFDHGEQMPDWVGYANENESPRLELAGVPDDAESLVIVMDDPEAEPVVGHVWDHWLVWDVDPDREEIPRGWEPGDEATVGFNDYGEQDWGGPAPPEGSHTYTFKVLALADELGAPPQARKSRLGSMIGTQTEILASTQLEGTYDADQGTIF